MNTEKQSRYYPPTGKRREEIAEKIKNAIKKDPSKDPCVVIEGKLVQTGSEHLDYAVILMQLIQEGLVSGSPNNGWVIESDEGVKTTITSEHRKTPQPQQELKTQVEYETNETGAEELLMQIVANPLQFSPRRPAEMFLDKETHISKDTITTALANLLADNILNINEDGSYSLDLYAPEDTHTSTFES